MDFSPHPLDGVWAKMARAAQHSRHLERLADRYKATFPVELLVRPEADSAVYRASLPADCRPPIHLAVVLGDVVSNLRSALDQAVWQLALKADDNGRLEHDPALARSIQFPIHHDRATWERRRSQLSRTLGKAAVDALEPLQPFNNQGQALVNPLALLQAISNTDKHRTRINFVGEIPLEDIEIAANGPLDIGQVEYLVPDRALIEGTTDLLRIPAPDAAEPLIMARATRCTDVCFVAEGYGMVRVSQIAGLATDLADGLGKLEDFFPSLPDLSQRLDEFLVPEWED